MAVNIRNKIIKEDKEQYEKFKICLSGVVEKIKDVLTDKGDLSVENIFELSPISEVIDETDFYIAGISVDVFNENFNIYIESYLKEFGIDVSTEWLHPKVNWTDGNCEIKFDLKYIILGLKGEEIKHFNTLKTCVFKILENKKHFILNSKEKYYEISFDVFEEPEITSSLLNSLFLDLGLENIYSKVQKEGNIQTINIFKICRVVNF